MKSAKGRVWLEATVLYRPIPWSRVLIERAVLPDEEVWGPADEPIYRPAGLPTSLAAKGLDTRMIIHGGIDLDRVPAGSVGFLEAHLRFWEEVQQLAFAFNEDDEARVRGFYQTYGWLGHSPFPGFHESWAWAKDVLNWFRMLVRLAQAVRDRKVGFLREYGHTHTIEDIGRGLKFGYFAPSYEWWGSSEPDGDRTFIIRFPYDEADWVDIETSIPPEDDDRLLRGTWREITRSATQYLDRITLVPGSQDYSDPSSPRVVWGFNARGAMEAAFLQWFFHEFTAVQPTICAARGCERFVPEGRTKWCSETCREREKKRHERHPEDYEKVRGKAR